MIGVFDLHLKVGTFTLERLSFSIPTGMYAVLMGRTGSGKSTLLEVIAGLRPIHAGRIELHNREVTHLKPGARGIGYVPQDLALFPTMRVREQLGFPLTIQKWARALVDERVSELANWLGITHLLDRRPQGLSGGESQRVALGRALAGRPRVLLLDEPLSALDEETREEMYDVLRTIAREAQVTILHVTHSLSEAKRLGDCILRLHQGQIQEVDSGA